VTHAPLKHRRRSIRLRGFDYSQCGAYFVTICAQDKMHLFGAIEKGRMHLNDCGIIVAESWDWLAAQYDYVALDEYAVMPNHFHGIIVIAGGDGMHTAAIHGRDGSRTAPTMPAAIVTDPAHSGRAETVRRKPLGRLIGAFKTVSTKRINEHRGTSGAPVWQRNFYEHVIRDEASLNRIRQYITDNPLHWEFDRDNPRAASRDGE
jgi:REP element-mobilizing transposase RayT